MVYKLEETYTQRIDCLFYIIRLIYVKYFKRARIIFVSF